MLYLKFYKPIITFTLRCKYGKTKLKFNHKKHVNLIKVFNSVQSNVNVSNSKVCFFTFKYKTQVNVLKQSRFTFRHELTFNKNHTFHKYTH